MRPEEEAALLAFAVGVLGGVEAALGGEQLALEVVEDGAGEFGVACRAGLAVQLQVQSWQQSVVVQHLFEVRHEPAEVRAVASEAAAEVIEDAAGGHLVRGEGGQLEGLDAAGAVVSGGDGEQELEVADVGELRRRAEASPGAVDAPDEPGDRGLEDLGWRDRVGGLAGGAAEVGDELVGAGVELLAAVRVEVGHAFADLSPRRAAVSRRGRVVGAAEERTAIGHQEAVERPAAAAGHGDEGVHVHGVDVGALLAVDLDADEVGVHDRGDLGIFERLALHDVAPVASRVANADEDRLVLAPRPLEGLGAPRRPVHGVVGVLAQVEADLVDETVGVGVVHGGPWGDEDRVSLEIRRPRGEVV